MALSPDEADRLLRELRQYAHAVIPSTQAADRLIEAALWDLMAIAPAREALAGRLRLFQAFHDQLRAALPTEGKGLRADVAGRVHGRVPRRGQTSSQASAREWLERRVAKLPQARREALLLCHLCGFTVPEIAKILRQRPDAVANALDQIWEALELPRSADILIIEDELLIALDISMLMMDLGHHVRGIASDSMEAAALLQQGAPDLILSDLQLGPLPWEGERIVATMEQEAVPVIYVTACPDRISRPLGRRPVFVVRKPFSAAQLSMAIYDALAAARARTREQG